MAIQQAQYEELLSDYSNPNGAISLLKNFRPYLEMIPSMRRSYESIITIPLPLIRIQTITSLVESNLPNANKSDALGLPCDIAILMCDPEWKIKTGVEIFVFIHRPQEDFSDLLRRWRQTQILVDKTYEWIMPPKYQHIFSEGSDKPHPLFIIFPESPKRIERGLRGANLPFVIETVDVWEYDSLNLGIATSEELSLEE